MHMADALLSPAAGGAMWAASAGTLGWCARRVREEMDDRKVPLMGVLGAFVFAAQMVNFTIPVTGSSGHLGGGMILAILLGPYAALLVMASVLTVQALFFADGGLLALGCNIFNLGFFPAFVGLPLYRRIAGRRPAQGRLAAACLVSAVAALQLGALGVVLQTFLSGVSELPFPTFLALMQPIHLAIGIVEGLVTAAVVSFVRKARPEVLDGSAAGPPPGGVPMGRLVAAFALLALLGGGVLSRYASTNPDGLEWSLAKASGKEGLEGKGKVHEALAALQGKLAFLPDYGFRRASEKQPDVTDEKHLRKAPPGEPAPPPSPGTAVPPPAGGEGGTTVAGIAGGAITLAVVLLAGFLLRRGGAPRT